MRHRCSNGGAVLLLAMVLLMLLMSTALVLTRGLAVRGLEFRRATAQAQAAQEALATRLQAADQGPVEAP